MRDQVEIVTGGAPKPREYRRRVTHALRARIDALSVGGGIRVEDRPTANAVEAYMKRGGWRTVRRTGDDGSVTVWRVA